MSGLSSGSRKINPDHQLPSEQTGPVKRGNRNMEERTYQRGFGGGGNYNRDEGGSYRGNR